MNKCKNCDQGLIGTCTDCRLSGVETIINRQIDLKKRFLDELGAFPTIQAVCKKIKISRSTYYRWIHNDPDFHQRSKEVMEEAIFEWNGIAESFLLNRVLEGDKSSIYFWLKRRHPNYKYKS